MTRDEAIDKIRRLLALAEGEGATPGEAANAAAAATALMERFRLAAAEVEREEEHESVTVAPDAMEQGSKLQAWTRLLLRGVCVQNGCRSLHTRTYSPGTRVMSLHILGRPSDVAVVRYTYVYLKREIERLADEHRGEGRSALNSFKLGAVHEVVRRLQQAKAEARQGATSTAIVKVDARDAEIERWKSNQKIPNARIRAQSRDAEAYQQGRIAGAMLALRPAMGQAESEKLLDKEGT